MKYILGLLLALPVCALSVCPNGCLAQYYTTTTTDEDVSGNGYTLDPGNGVDDPASYTDNCVQVGTSGAGAFSSTFYNKGNSSFISAWSSQSAFSVGVYLYITSLSTAQAIVSWGTIPTGTTYHYMEVNTDGSVEWHYTNAASFQTAASSITTNTCYFVAFVNDATSGKSIYVSDASSIDSTADATNADTGGTGTVSFLQTGREYSTGTPVMDTGYQNDLIFYTSALTTMPLDSNPASPQPIRIGPKRTLDRSVSFIDTIFNMFSTPAHASVDYAPGGREKVKNLVEYKVVERRQLETKRRILRGEITPTPVRRTPTPTPTPTPEKKLMRGFF